MEAETTLDAKSLKVLGADTRQEILKELRERPHTASELSRHLDKHITTITEHLDLLVDAGLVDRRERAGRKWVYYSLSGKGEKLFKPFSYNWVVILGLSVVCVFSGVYTLFAAVPPYQAAKELIAVEEARGGAATAAAIGISPLAILLLLAGLFGLAFVLYKLRK